MFALIRHDAAFDAAASLNRLARIEWSWHGFSPTGVAPENPANMSICQPKRMQRPEDKWSVQCRQMKKKD